MQDLKWLPTEKRIARGAYERALGRQFNSLIDETKQRASRISQPEDLWALEGWLTDQRKDIDQTFDYRYSVLVIVFAKLICRGFLTVHDLSGLGQEKIDQIMRTAEFIKQ